MTDTEKLLFIVANDTCSLETLTSSTGLTEDEIHDLYKEVHNRGWYRKLRNLSRPYMIKPERKMSFGGRLLKLIEQEKTFKSVSRLAQDIGISHASLYKYIETDTVPRRDALLKIARYFKVSPEWLETGMNEE